MQAGGIGTEAKAAFDSDLGCPASALRPTHEKLSKEKFKTQLPFFKKIPYTDNGTKYYFGLIGPTSCVWYFLHLICRAPLRTNMERKGEP